jgi:hypothetical protein
MPIDHVMSLDRHGTVQDVQASDDAENQDTDVGGKAVSATATQPADPWAKFDVVVDKADIAASEAAANKSGGLGVPEGIHAFIDDYSSKKGFSAEEAEILKKQASYESGNNPAHIYDADRAVKDGGASFGLMSVSSGFTRADVFNGEFQAKFDDGTPIEVQDFFNLTPDGTAGEQSSAQIANNLALGIGYMSELKEMESSIDGALRHYVNGSDTEAQRATDYVNGVMAADPSEVKDKSQHQAQAGTFDADMSTG